MSDLPPPSSPFSPPAMSAPEPASEAESATSTIIPATPGLPVIEVDKKTGDTYLRAVIVDHSPVWSKWLVKVLLSGTAFMAVLTMAAATTFQSMSLNNLSNDRQESEAVVNCGSLYSAAITEGNASVLSSLGRLIINVARAAPNDVVMTSVDALSSNIAHYDKAIDAREAWFIAGRPVAPCPISAEATDGD